MEHEDSAAAGMDAAAAARLLNVGEEVGTKVYESIDFRTQMLVQAGTAVAIFVYAGTYLFLFGGQAASEATYAAAGGAGFTITLLLPILSLSYLTLGVRERLRAMLPTHHRALAIILGLLALVPFLIVGFGTASGQNFPWWVLFLAALCPAIQPAALAVFSARSARLDDIRPPGPAPRVPLSDSALLMTVTLGVMFGVAAASEAFVWGGVAGGVLMLLLLVMFALYRTRWSLGAAGSEWGSAQWLGFGASFVLVMAMTVILTYVPDAGSWRGIVGVVGGLATAAPLVISAFRGSVIHERPEELWHAPTPQS